MAWLYSLGIDKKHEELILFQICLRISTLPTKRMDVSQKLFVQRDTLFVLCKKSLKTPTAFSALCERNGRIRKVTLRLYLLK